jgi:integrase/recombinase XerD
VKAILMQNHNLKHQTILMMCYASGLRVREVVALGIADIDSYRMVIYIRRAKGKKDRVVPLSEVLLQKLRNYIIQCRPDNYLFEGQYEVEQYTPEVCNSCSKKPRSEPMSPNPEVLTPYDTATQPIN